MLRNELDRRELLKMGLASSAWLAATLPAASLGGVARAASSVGITLAGTAKIDITPALPSPYDLGVQESTDRVAQPLYARLLYLESGAQRVLIVATDSEGILRSAYERLRRAIAAKTGLAPGQIVINSSHSHSGLYYSLDDEALLSPKGFHLLAMDSFEALVEQVSEGARQAIAGRQPVTLSVGEGQLPELAWNRRLMYLSDYHARRFNSRRKYPIGTTDPALGVVKVENAAGKTLALMCFYACHATVGEPGLSGDWPGFAMASLEREIGPECTALFIQGCAGNIAPNWRLQGEGASHAAVGVVGGLFAARVQHVLLTSMEKIAAPSFTIARAEFELPLRPLSYGPTAVGEVPLSRWFEPPPLVPEYQRGSIDDLQRRFERAALNFDRGHPENYGHWLMLALGDRIALAKNLSDWNRHEVRGFACGPLCLIFLPGETFVDFALEIKQNSPYRHTFVSAYNDTTITYVPDPIAFEEGGYETGPWCYSTPETGAVLVAHSVNLIKSLRQSS